MLRHDNLCFAHVLLHIKQHHVDILFSESFHVILNVLKKAKDFVAVDVNVWCMVSVYRFVISNQTVSRFSVFLQFSFFILFIHAF